MKIDTNIWQYCVVVSQSSHASIKAVEAVEKIHKDKKQNEPQSLDINHSIEVNVIRKMATIYRQDSSKQPYELAKMALPTFHLIWDVPNAEAGYHQKLINHFAELWMKLAAEGIVFKTVISW